LATTGVDCVLNESMRFTCAACVVDSVRRRKKKISKKSEKKKVC
jgi:hypothetical protein